MRSRDELQGRLECDRVDGSPERAVVEAVDVVVRLVLMPGSLLTCARLLHQHVIVVQPHVAAHQVAGGVSSAGVDRDVAELRDALPVAEVLAEPARIVRLARHLESRTRVREIALDAAFDRRDLLGGEESPDHDNAVAVEVLDLLGTEDGGVECGRHGPSRGRVRRNVWPQCVHEKR